MNDRELLEMAAKAAGIDYEERYETPSGAEFQGLLVREPRIQFWDPLADDGDAFRLAMKLGMHITVATAEIWRGGREMIHVFEDSGDDFAATRRAVVRAAAEIGMGKP